MHWLQYDEYIVGFDVFLCCVDTEAMAFFPAHNNNSDLDSDEVPCSDSFGSSDMFIEADDYDNEPADEDMEFSGSCKSESSLSVYTIVFLLQLQVTHGISNNAINDIFKFFKKVLKLLTDAANNLSVEKYFRTFPPTLYAALKRVNVNAKSFQEYPVCPGCKSVYTLEECVETCGSIRRAKKCKKKVGHSICNSNIVTSKPTRSGIVFKPLQTFCYNSIADLLHFRANNDPSFLSSCKAWKEKQREQGSRPLYHDVFDGAIWKDFGSFLQVPTNLVLQLNVDWFQPFDHVVYSVGVLYITVLNLPSSERYKIRNAFLVGIIPGPDEPKHDVNNFLRPLIDDLLVLWDKGIQVNSANGALTIKCALGCVACDIPAARKIAGFTGHSSHLGCSKCKKEFRSVTGMNKLDYSGFDRSNWPKRSNQQHREDVHTVISCTTKTDREKRESELGCRYSALLDLPYFDPVRMHVIDPMHNLFLGSAKRFMSVLIDTGAISKDCLLSIQKTVDSITVPDGIGRIPLKIQSGFSRLTAEQWKNWTVLYSIVALKPLVSFEILECWRHFVLACRYILQKVLSEVDIQIADALLIRFCTKFELLFGKSNITPNMHLHCHLKECLKDYGPLRSFWLFAFERYNGVLGSQTTNSRNIEPQLMRRFCQESELGAVSLSEQFADDLCTFLPHGRNEDLVELSAKPIEDSLSTRDIDILQKFLGIVHAVSQSSITISSPIKKYPFIILQHRKFGSKLDRRLKQTVVLAKWPVNLYGVPASELAHQSYNADEMYYLRPFIVDVYLDVSYCIEGTMQTVVLARGTWPKYSENYMYFGKPYTVWCNDLVEFDYPLSSFININQIVHNCSYFTSSINNIGILCVCPVIG